MRSSLVVEEGENCGHPPVYLGFVGQASGIGKRRRPHCQQPKQRPRRVAAAATRAQPEHPPGRTPLDRDPLFRHAVMCGYVVSGSEVRS